MSGLSGDPPLCFFDDSLDLLQQQAVSRALATKQLLLIEAADPVRRQAVLAELLRQMAFRGMNVLVLRAPDCTAAELNGHAESVEMARLQWSNLLKLAERATSISRESDVTGPSWWRRWTRWLRRPSRMGSEQSPASIEGIVQAWAACCDQLTGFCLSPPSLSALSNWHGQMCSTETANDVEATCHETPDNRVDVMLLLSGEHVNDEMVSRLTAKGARLIIVGVLPAVNSTDISSAREQDASASATFGRLWRSMQHPPFLAQYRWVEEAGHIVCRLDDYPYDSTYVERERVADLPEIELRIDSPPHGSPRLVEIVFPRGQGILESKEFAYRELEHLALDATGNGLHWTEEAGHLTVRLSPVQSQRYCCIEVAPGAEERVCFVKCEEPSAGRWITERLKFDRTQGWDRKRAESWLRSQAGFWNDERTLSLEVAGS